MGWLKQERDRSTARTIARAVPLIDRDELTRVLTQVAAESEINCTGPGEVACRAREGWHSWSDHRRHVAVDQADLVIAFLGGEAS